MATAQPVAPAQWECRFCPSTSGTEGSWWLGSSYVSDASGKFGDYTGLDDDGFYVFAEGDWRSRLDDGRYWSLRAEDFGLESRSIAAEGGRPGRYRVNFQYDAIPKFRYDEVWTPFSLGSRARLPDNWVTAGSTAGFTALAASQRPVAIGHDRERLMAGLEWRSREQLDYRAEFRRDTRSGKQLIAGSFAAVSAWLPAPLDYVTDEVDFAVGRAREAATFEVGYRGSRFSNHVPTVEWQNPFTPFVTGADLGQLAMVPGNRSRQLYANGTLRIGRTSFAAQLSSASIEQDDPFVAATVNPTLGEVPLPRSSLDGEVDSRRLTVDIASRLSSRLRLTARVERNERDNRTAVAAFTTVLTDLAVGAVRSNTPYDFERSRLKVDADYRLPNRVGLKFGAERDRWQRQLQARERTDEDAFWIGLDVRRWDAVRLVARLTDRQRRGSDYSVLDRGGALQNPRLRQYHLADRDRRVASVDLSYTPVAAVTTSLQLESSDDRYPESELGLQAGDSQRVSLDVGFDLGAGLHGYASIGRDEVEFDQTGSQQFGMADWRANTQESTTASAIGLSRAVPGNRLALQIDLNTSQSTSRTAVFTGNPQAVFPDFRTKLKGLTLTGVYTVNAQLRVRMSYRYERYSNADWQLDGVDPTTIPSILTVDALIPRYSVDMFTVAFSYAPSGQ
jgi:MtrB/PioB family decaheme-associated outer membrane protein